MSETDVLKMKVADLKRELKLRGLSTVGNKTDLQERLQTVLLDGDLSLEDTVISEDILGEDVLTDEEEKSALESPQNEKKLLQEVKVEEKTAAAVDTSQQPKKVILKRKNSICTSFNSASVLADENLEPPEKVSNLESIQDVSNDSKEGNTNLNSEGKKIVKLSELSIKERLEMRAKKFGVATKDSTKSISGSNNEKELEQIQALKKRAERFGCVLSSKIADIEKQEKLQKRKERFGAIGVNSANIGSDSYAEKAKLRLERFKQGKEEPINHKMDSK